MRNYKLLIILIFIGVLFAQSWEKPYRHISADHDHSSNNCYGYALSRFAGKTKNDRFCDPITTWAPQIDNSILNQDYSNLRPGDILVWGGSLKKDNLMRLGCY